MSLLCGACVGIEVYVRRALFIGVWIMMGTTDSQDSGNATSDTTMQPSKLWLVAPDDLQGQLRGPLSQSGFEVEIVTNPRELSQPQSSTSATGLLLAQESPGLNLLDVLREFRRVSSLPVFLIVKAENETDALIGLELGADDYLIEPVNPRVLVSRMRALLRRCRQTSAITARMPILKRADVVVDIAMRAAWRGNEKLHLTTVEFNLLQFLCEAQGTPLSREELVQRVLGRAAHPTDRSLDVHISNLRKKLGGANYIKGLRGIGYVFIGVNENEVSA